MAIMLRRDIKLYTTVEPPTVDPSVAPPKIFAKYALSRKSADTPEFDPCMLPVAKVWERFDSVIR
jgi:hypothetical protein